MKTIQIQNKGPKPVPGCIGSLFVPEDLPLLLVNGGWF
jgi:hypothetical protein